MHHFASPFLPLSPTPCVFPCPDMIENGVGLGQQFDNIFFLNTMDAYKALICDEASGCRHTRIYARGIEGTEEEHAERATDVMAERRM